MKIYCSWYFYRTLIGAKPLRISCNIVIGLFRVYDWTKCLVLFAFGNYSVIYDRIRYLIGLESGSITYVYPYNFKKIKIDSEDNLPLEKHWHCIML